MIIVSKWKLEYNGFVKGIRCFRVIAEDEIPCPCPDCVGKLIKKGCVLVFLAAQKKGATKDIIKYPEKPTLIEVETVAHLLAWRVLMAAYILRVAPSIT